MLKKIKCIADFESELTHGGVTFHKGRFATVDTDTVSIYPWFDGNPMFVIEDVEAETDDDDAERERLMAILDEAGTKYRKNSSVATLAKLVDDKAE